ncbi:hypothetical protein AcidC75_24830 [Acidisoma sp. C75]
MLVKKSFTIAGHRTSVALEAEFWQVLEAMAAMQGLALGALVVAVDANRASAQPLAGRPLASALRLTALAAAARGGPPAQCVRAAAGPEPVPLPGVEGAPSATPGAGTPP